MNEIGLYRDRDRHRCCESSYRRGLFDGKTDGKPLSEPTNIKTLKPERGQAVGLKGGKLGQAALPK